MSGMRLLLVGASGVVGNAVLAQALASSEIARITAPTRRALMVTDARLNNPLADFNALTGKEAWWSCDALICTLGTTMRQAGSQAAFAAVDRDLPVACARFAQAAGASRCALNSSLGASLKGNFYLRTKAQAELGIRDLNFASTTIVRPSLIDAERSEARPGERIGIVVARSLRSLIPRRYRAVTPEAIARALLDGVLVGRAGVAIIESDALR